MRCNKATGRLAWKGKAHYDEDMLALPFLRHPLPLLLLLGSLGPLSAALFSQYVLGYPPCPLCMWQRYPYALPLLAGLIALHPRFRNWRGLLVVGILGWLITAGIAGYHVGIEHGWITHEGGCSAGALTGSAADIRTSIMNAPLVACNTVALRILGFSMANWNLAVALAFALMARTLHTRMGNV